MPSGAVASDFGQSPRYHFNSLVRKRFRVFLVESTLVRLTKFEHGIVPIPEDFPKTATLYRIHTLALARPTLNDTGRAETNRFWEVIPGGTRIALERRQKYIRAAEVAHIVRTTAYKTVGNLLESTVLVGIFLFKYVVQKFNQPGDLLTKWVYRVEGRSWSIVNQSVQGGSPLDECLINRLLYAIDFGPTNPAQLHLNGESGNSREDVPSVEG